MVETFETYGCLAVFVSVRRLGTYECDGISYGRAGAFEAYGCLIVFAPVRGLGIRELHCMNSGRAGAFEI